MALEQVKCYGTEGRKANPSEEIPASDTLYDFIRFRGSDVKDLRIDEVAAVKENLPPRIPNDPAIMSSVSVQRLLLLPRQSMEDAVFGWLLSLPAEVVSGAVPVYTMQNPGFKPYYSPKAQTLLGNLRCLPSD